MSFDTHLLNANISAELQTNINDTVQPYFCNTVTYIRLTTVLLLRAGYVLIQIGSIPINDVYSLILHNILDITVTICSYGLVGYMFSLGQESLGGFMGSSTSLSAGYPDLDSLIHGFSACLIGSAIVTTMLAGRVLPMTAATTSFLQAGLIQPIVMHWVWHDKGWMAKMKVLKVKFSVKDHGGGLPIHLTSGVAALWGSVCLGRRLVKLKDVSASSVGTASPGMTFIGYVFVFIGLTSFTLPTQKYEQNRIPGDFIGITLTNCLMALTSGLFVVIMQCFCFGRVSGYWILLKCLQGSLAGLVTVSSGVDVYDHLVAFFVAATGTVVFYCVTIVLERMFYEDYCNVVPVHLFCAFVGALLPPLVGNGENLGFQGTSISLAYRLYHTGWQVVCAFAVIAWSTTFFLPLFVFLQAMGLLANKNEEMNHRRSLNVLKNVDSKRRFWRIFSYSEFAPFVEPGSETRSGKSLDFLKKSNDSRRELLEAAMAKKQEAKGPKQLNMVKTPAVPTEEIVKDMGILEAERYPASYEEDLEKRLTTHKSLYETITEPVAVVTQEQGVHRNASGDYVHPEKIVKAEIHNVSELKDKKEGNVKRKISPRRRPHTVRRKKKKLKRLDSDFSLKKPKKK
ncbi:putative ammonium transporter 1 [Coccinella septempunctata]|uniref:putative ammonium transporter 1 n=1 Tax=Coccinella septempunctata TaxID=41139 RepID=UPI001D0821F4|nr:putative ammonium transporter 1 [Coccinella septempunctata]